MRRTAALIVASIVLALLANGLNKPAAADITAGAASEPLSTTSCSAAQLSDIITVYMTAATTKAAAPFPPGTRSYLAYILRSRLRGCERQIAGHLARAACTPLPNENDVRHLWTQLNFCIALVRQMVPDPPPTVHPADNMTNWDLPSTSGVGSRPVIFVIGVGADPAMVSKLVSTLTVYLNDGRDETGYYFSGNAVLVPEPSWAPSDYVSQCQASPQVEGAVVLDITAAGSGAADEFIRRRSWTAIEATALYAKCARTTEKAQGDPSIVWVSDVAMKQAQRITLTPLTPLAMLLTLGAAYEEFAPAKQTTVTTTHVFPAPKTTPPGGYNSQVSTTHATTVNAAGLSSVAGGLLGSAITYTNIAAPLTQSPAVDQQTWDTLQSLSIELIKDMNCWQPEPASIGTPSAQDVVGAARILPAYNPPAGLGRFVPGESSAPFCAEPRDSESITDVLPVTRRSR